MVQVIDLKERKDSNRVAEQGFTLTELLIAIAVGAIASVLMTTAFVFTYSSVVIEQTKTAMVRDSQTFLRRMVEDIRVANQIRQTNIIDDPSIAGTGGEWITSDPANIIIVTSPATDTSNDLIFDPVTGYPYQHEALYFSSDNTMYRRLLVDTAATGNNQQTTCPAGTVGCKQDVELVRNVDNMLFEFYDGNDQITTVAEDARSVEITINLRKTISGQNITTTNTTRVTLRNEN